MYIFCNPTKRLYTLSTCLGCKKHRPEEAFQYQQLYKAPRSQQARHQRGSAQMDLSKLGSVGVGCRWEWEPEKLSKEGSVGVGCR